MKLPTEPNPWQTHASELVHQNPWFCVTENSVTRPDGSPGKYFVIDARVATGVIALTEKDEVVLVGQYRYPTNCYSWEIVEGGADVGEEPLHAIQRELVEEAGYQARHWEPLGGRLYLSNCISSEVGYLFVARDLIPTSASPDPTEKLLVRTLPIEECLRLIDSGEITDALTIMALLFYDRQRQREA